MADQGKHPSDEPSYWRSLRELRAGESVSEQKAHEFMAGVTDDVDPSALSPMSRKQFLALLSASAAFAAAGCTNYRDKGEIVPYTKKPEDITPGIANYYASTCTGCPQACGILIKTREGRPIKIDGNPDHPINRGKTCAKGQASILNLYDPNRLRRPAYGSRSGKIGELSWDQVDANVRDHLDACVRASREIALIVHPTTSPTARKLLAEFCATFPTSTPYTYSLVHEENRRRAWEACYGTDSLPVVAWERARIIVALESDFLGTEGNTVEQIRKFAGGRDVMQSTEFNRLYAIEGRVSLTGANADYRLRLRPDAQLGLVLAILHEIAVRRKAIAANVSLVESMNPLPLTPFAAANQLPIATLERLVDDLLANRGSAIIHAGSGLSEEVHRAVNYLNDLLDNTRLVGDGALDLPPLSTTSSLTQLVQRMKNGEVGMVIHLDTNPVHQLPPSLEYASALRAVPLTVSLTEQENETAELCTYALPVNHTYESWGDYAPRTDVLSLQQPVIAPLYDTRQKEAALLTWMNAAEPYSETVYHRYLMKHWQESIYPALHVGIEVSPFWYAALHDGVVRRKTSAATPGKFSEKALDGVRLTGETGGFALGLYESAFLGDGRFANNGWLQELPDPVSKIVWDNYAAVAPATAKELGVESNDLIDVRLPHGTQRLPVVVQPGQAEHYIATSVGYGRWNAGPIGSGVGVNTHVLLDGDSLTGVRFWTGAKVARAAGRYELTSTQEHHPLDDEFLKDIHLKRKVIREGTLDQYRRDPGFLHEGKNELSSISTEVTYNGVKWAMAIDLNKCIGCNVCVSGCSVENNIPVVGKEQVQKGREMQWIRLDRYYAGTPENPSLSHQPMLCQHCDQAPCENVCPVVATTHSPDGLNQMVYNRCVGTKYCSNNCPYKVRRFNFYNFRNNLADGYYEQEPVSLMHNPEVTVRSRGVMEKCTFCVQRIAEARQHAAERGRPLRGSDVATACQDACPAQAIVFGDMNDPNADISRYRKHDLGYHVLEEVNARPNVTYLAKLRNIHSEGPA